MSEIRDHAEYDPLCLVFNEFQWFSRVSALLAELAEDLPFSDVLALNPTIHSGVWRFTVVTGSVTKFLVRNSALQPAPA